MVIESMLSALGSLLTLEHMLYLCLGVMLGIVIGILPGLGGIVGFSIMLPFLYGMDTTSALALLIGLVAVIPTSDTFTSVLMGIPGSSSSQATVLDGYQLSKQGKAARALSAAFTSSLVGGLIGAVILTAFVLFAKPVILAFTSAELFMLGVLGLSMVGVLSGNNIYKGFIACAIGLLLGAVGSAPATGEWRMTFGSYYLFDGMKLVIVGLGIFAVPEIVDLMVKNKKISTSKANTLGSGWKQGVKDVWLYKWIVARCAPIGALIGAIPGLGGSVVDWIAYGHVVQTAKDKSKFGKGDIRGVIAPESSNNAKEGGGLVPTLLFGIPGSGSMAVFLGGLTILGVEPGPNLVTDELDITYTIIWSLALANLVGASACVLLSGSIARLTNIHYGYLAPFMIMVICFAALQATRSLEDLMLLLFIGMIGIVFKYFSWPRPALLIGFVLADTIETYLYQAAQFYSWSFLLRPGVLFLLAVIAISLVMGNIINRKKNERVEAVAHHQDKQTKTEPFSRFSGELVFTLLALAFALYAVIDGLENSWLGSLFTTISAIALLLAGAVLVYKLVTAKHQSSNLSRPLITSGVLCREWRALWQNFLWIVAMVAVTALFGFIVALGFIFIMLLRVKAQASVFRIILLTLLAVGFIVFISQVMVLHLPTGLVFDWLNL